MFYHASPYGNIITLEPRISSHGKPLIYFSTKRENVLVYLSNAVEKYCLETGFAYEGIWQKWASYGFDKDGTQYIEEYYPNALIKTYKGVSGYIYSAENIKEASFEIRIPFSAVCSDPVPVTNVEFIPDAYEAIINAEKSGLLKIIRYEEMSEKARKRNEQMVKQEYEQASEHPEYRHFIQGNFPHLFL